MPLPSPTDTMLAAELTPIVARERISSVDILRGFALLGILLMNIIEFALPINASYNPAVAGGSTGANLALWIFQYVLVDGKMRAIFSMLFGAGVVLLTSQTEKSGGATHVADIYYRRILWLLLFGVIHAYVLLWPGDILYPYALCGLLLYPLRKLSPRSLIIAGLLVLAVLVPKHLLEAHEINAMHAKAAETERVIASGQEPTQEQQKAQEQWQEKLKERKPDQAHIAENIKTMRGSYPAIFKFFVGLTTNLQSVFFYRWGFWDVAGMMLLGMGLFKLGVFSAVRSRRFYALMAVFGYGIGIPLNAYVAATLLASNFDVLRALTLATTYDVGRLAIALGHISILLLVYKAGLLKWLTSRLAAVGQMALSNYVMHTVICTLLFYGYGFGLFGQLQRVQLFGVVLAIWSFQLIVSPIWLRYFRFGPVEWVWRQLTYQQRLPLRS